MFAALSKKYISNNFFHDTFTMIYRVLLISVLNLTFIASGLCQSNKKATKPLPLFTVKKSPVAADEFIYLFSKNHQKGKDEYTQQAIEEYLNLYINFKLKVREARSRGMDTTKVFRDEFESYKKELVKPYLPDTKIIDSLVLLTYNRLKEEVRASHILITVKPDASPADTLAAFNKVMDVKKRVQEGESFESLAPLYSDDPSAKTNNGDLGYFTALQMVYPFENGAYETKIGSVGGPYRTKFGYHLIKVVHRKPARGEVEVSHIMIRTDEKDEEKAKLQIFNIYDMLAAGAKWDEVCAQYSEDQSTKDKGGRLRPFGVGAMSSVPEFEKVAFALKNPGDISDPFQTNFGWHIVRLESKKPIGDYEGMKAQIRSGVLKDDRLQVSKDFVFTKFKKEFSYTENELVAKKVFDSADSTLLSGKWDGSKWAGMQKEVLFSLSKKNFTVQDFANYIKSTQKPATGKPFDAMKHHYDEFVNTSIMRLVEDKIGRENPDFAMLTNEYYEGILLFNIMEEEVWNKAAKDSLGQLNYYKANVNKYHADERVKGVLYASSHAGFRDTLKVLIESGDSVARAKFVKEADLKTESGVFEKGDRAILSQIEWAKGIYFCENNGMYYLAEIRETVPPGNKAFDECRAQVITDYQAELEKKWIAQLRQTYPIKVNEKGKKYVLDKLQK